MVQKLILIRHGEPKTPTPEKYCIGGRTDWPLSDEGIRQCKMLSEQLLPVIRRERKDGRIVEIWSSTMQRAEQTASFLCEEGERPKLCEDFREMDAGEWDGKPFRQIREAYPEVYQARTRDSGMSLIPGSENNEAGLRRFSTALKTVLENTLADTVVVVSHGTVIRLFMNSLQQCGDTEPAAAEKLPYTGVAEPDMTAVRQNLSIVSEIPSD